MRPATATSRPLPRAGSQRAVRVVAQAVAVVGLATVVGCADAGPQPCAELQAALDELEGRSVAPDGEQSWDAVEATATATAERDRLTAEMARAGCGAGT
jgi:hypothetical protein